MKMRELIEKGHDGIEAAYKAVQHAVNRTDDEGALTGQMELYQAYADAASDPADKKEFQAIVDAMGRVVSLRRKAKSALLKKRYSDIKKKLKHEEYIEEALRGFDKKLGLSRGDVFLAQALGHLWKVSDAIMSADDMKRAAKVDKLIIELGKDVSSVDKDRPGYQDAFLSIAQKVYGRMPSKKKYTVVP